MIDRRIESVVLGVVIFVAVGRAAAAPDPIPAGWQLHDETRAACGCSYVAPAGIKIAAHGGKATHLEGKGKRAQWELTVVPATQTAAAAVAEWLGADDQRPDARNDCGDAIAPPKEQGGWQCGQGGGCNGQWYFAFCGQLRPHPAGGQQLITVMASAADGIDMFGGIEALIAASNRAVGLTAARGGTVDAAGAPTPAAVAKVANARGMKRYRAKDFASAAAAFSEAIKADDSLVVAHYNLACVASLQHDTTTALLQLEWLAASADPAAKARLDKARVDPDLTFVRESAPRARALVGLPAQ